MEDSSNNIIPWTLIASDLQGELLPAEKDQLKEWINSSAENKEKYDQLLRLWSGSLEDYPIYQNANASTAWDELKKQLSTKKHLKEKAPIISGQFKSRKHQVMKWTAIAALLIGIFGIGFFYMFNHNSIIEYQTQSKEQKTVLLPDGTSIVMEEQSRIEISRSYNSNNTRTIALIHGTAFFDVKHIEKNPFIVDMGSSRVQDIGTSFTIAKGNDSIKVSVSTGKIAFINNTNQDSIELSAGMVLSFQIQGGNFGKISSTETGSNVFMLHFENTELSRVIIQLQQVYNKKIVLDDTRLEQKRFTASLEGQSFETALNILCKSLNLKAVKKNDVYQLREGE